MRAVLPVLPVLPLWPLAVACGASEEAATVTLPVATAAGAFEPVTTDLGHVLTITRLRAAIADLELTIEGEMHDAVAGGAIFHPGHSAGGDVTGEMPGDFILDWDGQGAPLGEATLIVGDYQGANWTWRTTTEADGLAADDPLLGHTSHVEGVAAQGGVDRPFDAVLDIEAATQLVGAVFELTVTETSTDTLVIELLPTDPSEGDTAFDGVDFAALPVDDDGVARIRPGDTAANVLRRAIQTHDHYAIESQEN